LPWFQNEATLAADRKRVDNRFEVRDGEVVISVATSVVVNAGEKRSTNAA
jgi:hypothetical protein